ncbi:hypothetical protein ACFOZY_03810 [Chungangia koreensis]|uniref:DUF8042 domain-containing protein n=1 Tax=Chungangia koreensis TaxID=752657 RepID=A0ABV8X0U9_9LACT
MIQILVESIESYNIYLKKVPEGCQSIADLLRGDNVHEALTLILQFSEGVTWLTDMNAKINELGIQNDLQIDKIHEFLNEVNQGLFIQDYIVVADMFEYEIKPFFKECTLYDLKEII